MASHPNLEQQLELQLRQAEPTYRRALQTLRAESGSDNWQAAVRQLQPAMRQIQDMENTLAPLRQAWNESGLRAGRSLQVQLGTHRVLLEELLEKIGTLEAHVQARRAELAPQLDQHLKHQKMQQAYQPAGRWKNREGLETGV